MRYTIHGKEIEIDENVKYGIYKSRDSIQRPDYAEMDIKSVVKTIDELPYNSAIATLIDFKDLASKQIKWEHAPQNPGFPILIQTGPSPAPIDQVREYIINTESFCKYVLTVLQGE